MIENILINNKIMSEMELGTFLCNQVHVIAEEICRKKLTDRRLIETMLENGKSEMQLVQWPKR